jgi:hypothetical protein
MYLAIFCLVALAITLPILLLIWTDPPRRTLRVDRQTITLTDRRPVRTKERQMNAAGMKVSAVYLDFFDRLFSLDAYRTRFAYHIEITRSGESFLFPCNDEREQSQIIKQIKEFLVQ